MAVDFRLQDEAKQWVVLHALAAYQPMNGYERKAVPEIMEKLEAVIAFREAPKAGRKRQPRPKPAPKPAAKREKPEPFKHPALAVLEARGEVTKPGECDCGAKLQTGRCVSCEAIEARWAGARA